MLGPVPGAGAVQQEQEEAQEMADDTQPHIEQRCQQLGEGEVDQITGGNIYSLIPNNEQEAVPLFTHIEAGATVANVSRLLPGSSIQDYISSPNKPTL